MLYFECLLHAICMSAFLDSISSASDLIQSQCMALYTFAIDWLVMLQA